MAYVKGVWVDDVSPLSAARLNNLEKQYDEVKVELGNNSGELWGQIKAVDGAGSGLDADKVDGYQAKDVAMSVQRDVAGIIAFQATPLYQNDNEVSIVTVNNHNLYDWGGKTITVDFDAVNFLQVEAECNMPRNFRFYLTLMDNTILLPLDVFTPYYTYVIKTGIIDCQNLTGVQTLKVRFSGDSAVGYTAYQRNLRLYANKVAKVVW